MTDSCVRFMRALQCHGCTTRKQPGMKRALQYHGCSTRKQPVWASVASGTNHSVLVSEFAGQAPGYSGTCSTLRGSDSASIRRDQNRVNHWPTLRSNTSFVRIPAFGSTAHSVQQAELPCGHRQP